MPNFEDWNKKFNEQNLFDFNGNSEGLLWLKVRAVCRAKLLEKFLKENSIQLTSKKSADKNKELFTILQNRGDASKILNDFLKNQNNEWYRQMNINEVQLKTDLYRIEQYEWGGDQNNSLDKHLISRYVKIISQFQELQSHKLAIEANAWNYVQTSWYNNWTSYLVESIFKKHPRVISSIGENKSVDFFIDDYPIDLKITFFPQQYMAQKIKEQLGNHEFAWLKKQAKHVGITVDSSLPESQQIRMLSEQLHQQGHNNILQRLNKTRQDIIAEAQNNPIDLMTWLYTNQGEMRFGAENRIYLIVVDTQDIAQSWKLKRAFNLILPKVEEYLKQFDANTLKEINFSFKGKNYKSLSDIIFILNS